MDKNLNKIFNEKDLKTYYDLLDKIDEMGKVLFDHIVKYCPNFVKDNLGGNPDYVRTDFKKGSILIGYNDLNSGMLNPFRQYYIPAEQVFVDGEIDFKHFKRWMIYKENNSKSSIETRRKWQEKIDYAKYLKLKEKYESVKETEET